MAGYGSLEENVENRMLAHFPPDSNAGANYARISMLVMDEGTKVAARRVLDNLSDYQTLEEALHAGCHQMQSLLDRNIIHKAQIAILYPEGRSLVKREDIDLTLWVILLRHITTNAKSINKKWVEEPQFWQQQFWHDIQRLKRILNDLAHNGKAELEEESFQKMWRKTQMVLLRLGVPAPTIHGYLEREIDPESARKVTQKVQGQFLNDLTALLRQSKGQNRRLKMLLCFIAAIIIVLVAVSVAVPFFLPSHCESCADNIMYARTNYAMVSYLTKKGWGAEKAKPMPKLSTPVQYVIVSHTAQVTNPCYTTDDCCSTVREIQRYNIEESGYPDIAFNYLIGGNGIVFIGRGPNHEWTPEHGWEKKSVSVGFIGLFTLRAPTDEAIDALSIYLGVMVNNSVIDQNYILYGRCQIDTEYPHAPGAAFMRVLERDFKLHWRNDNMTNCKDVA